uniref:Si:dkey-117n7.5 n=1 Tax=Poecilia reticulata TaxID=8081 RepID=A0A3P9P9T4_POERE
MYFLLSNLVEFYWDHQTIDFEVLIYISQIQLVNLFCSFQYYKLHLPPFLKKKIKKEIDLTDRCLLPMSEGACSEYALVWYFHGQSGECRPFVYGGCGGNQNRFPSKQDCESLCGTKSRHRKKRGNNSTVEQSDISYITNSFA